MSYARAVTFALILSVGFVLQIVAFGAKEFSWHPVVGVGLCFLSIFLPSNIKLISILSGTAILAGWWFGLWGYGPFWLAG